MFTGLRLDLWHKRSDMVLPGLYPQVTMEQMKNCGEEKVSEASKEACGR